MLLPPRSSPVGRTGDPGLERLRLRLGVAVSILTVAYLAALPLLGAR